MARILVVEDDMAVREDIADTLGDWGHEVLMAEDGVGGYDAIRTWGPDIVLSDINMPGETGLDLVNRIAQQGTNFANMSFIFISSITSPKAIVFGIQCGADDYITKPINYDLLKVKIDSQLRKTNKLLSKATIEKVALTMGQTMANGAVGVCAVGALGVCAIFALYWLKSALGINLFSDMHFSDLF